jgi:hypothetical protein
MLNFKSGINIFTVILVSPKTFRIFNSESRVSTYVEMRMAAIASTSNPSELKMVDAFIDWKSPEMTSVLAILPHQPHALQVAFYAMQRFGPDAQKFVIYRNQAASLQIVD